MMHSYHFLSTIRKEKYKPICFLKGVAIMYFILGLQILKSNKKRDRNNILASISQDGRMVADSRSY